MHLDMWVTNAAKLMDLSQFSTVKKTNFNPVNQLEMWETQTAGNQWTNPLKLGKKWNFRLQNALRVRGTKQCSECGLLGRSVKLPDYGRIAYPKGNYN